VKLYRRLSKGVEITEAGQSFLYYANSILDLVAKLEDTSKRFKKNGLQGF
jgi:DNA-binding transcriptional LysR family regulator